MFCPRTYRVIGFIPWPKIGAYVVQREKRWVLYLVRVAIGGILDNAFWVEHIDVVFATNTNIQGTGAFKLAFFVISYNMART
ncbi:Uncharacterised protein [Chlamydia trachomatis]|nr:Uncharacterised protein [Chlamydia trachomatis]